MDGADVVLVDRISVPTREPIKLTNRLMRESKYCSHGSTTNLSNVHMYLPTHVEISNAAELLVPLQSSTPPLLTSIEDFYVRALLKHPTVSG